MKYGFKDGFGLFVKPIGGGTVNEFPVTPPFRMRVVGERTKWSYPPVEGTVISVEKDGTNIVKWDTGQLCTFRPVDNKGCSEGEYNWDISGDLP